MTRRKTTLVIIPGRKTPGLRLIKRGLYCVQLEGVKYSDAFTAEDDGAAADWADDYVARGRAYNAHGDLTTEALLVAWFWRYGNANTAHRYWTAMQAGGPPPARKGSPAPGGFIGTFGARELQTITAVELAEYFEGATFTDGRPMDYRGRRQLQAAIGQLFEQANTQLPNAAKLSKRTLMQDPAVQEAILGTAAQVEEESKPAVALTLEELEALAGGVEDGVLTIGEIRRLLKALETAPLHHRLIVLVMVTFGLRINEVLMLHRTDVALKLAILQVRGAIGRGKGAPRQETGGKGRRRRARKEKKAAVKFIPTRLRPVLQTALNELQLEGNPYLFPGTKEGLPMAYTTVRDIVNGRLAEIGIDRVKATHWLRHQRITEGAAVGDFKEQDPELLKQIGAHESTAVAKLYVHQKVDKMIHEAGQANALLAQLLGPELVPDPGQENIAKWDNVVPIAVLAHNKANDSGRQ